MSSRNQTRRHSTDNAAVAFCYAVAFAVVLGIALHIITLVWPQ